jgi:hypothetical protein
MTEWWTYSPQNFLMFSARTYYRLFASHNQALWPAQFLALAAGVVIAIVIARRTDAMAGRIAATLLAIAWLAVAGGYFWMRYATIHTAGRYFAAAFAVEAAALVWEGVTRRGLEFSLGRGVGRVGAVVFGFALLLYPLIARLAGRPWTQAEIFGLAPDPTVIATLGLLLAAKRAAWWLWVIPIGWSLFSGMTLWTLHSPDAAVGPVLAGICVALGVWKWRRPAKP